MRDLVEQSAGGVHLANEVAHVIPGGLVGLDHDRETRVDAHLHYRSVDVSSIQELARHWVPRIYFSAPPKNGGHRALADIRESIAELRYYREAVFVPQPGPDSPTAKALAARHVVA